jgi:protein TonB
MKALIFVIAGIMNIASPTNNPVSAPAQYPGGTEELVDFLADHVEYPTEAREQAVEGIVKIRFEVTPDGQIQNARVVKSVGYGCDEAAMKAVHAMPNWTPAYQNGEAVNMKVTLPIQFKITD